MVINWNFTDSTAAVRADLENSALTYVAGKHAANADATVTLARDADAVALQQTTFPMRSRPGLVKIDGDAAKLDELFSMLDTFKVMFEVVEPKPSPSINAAGVPYGFISGRRGASGFSGEIRRHRDQIRLPAAGPPPGSRPYPREKIDSLPEERTIAFPLTLDSGMPLLH